MPVGIPKTSKFLNSREWRTFLAAAQAAASCPSVVRAVQAGQAWLTGSPSPPAAKPSSLAAKISGATPRWLLVERTLLSDSAKTLGI